MARKEQGRGVRVKPSKNGHLVSDDQAGADEGPELAVEVAAECKTERTEWLWRARLEWPSVAIIQGGKGAGKSTWMRAIAADVTGGPRLPGERGRRRVAGNVLWFAGEESRRKTVHPNLAAAGADLRRVITADNLGEDSDVLALPNDCHRLRRLILARKVALVVIDPIFSFLDGSLDIEAGSVQARRFVGQLLRVAQATGALILFSRNLTKDTSRGALAAGRGSGELGNAARSVLHCQELPHSPQLYGLATAAVNNAKPCPTLQYRFEEQAGCRTVKVLGEISLTADELCAGEDGDLDRSSLEAAKELIKAMLPQGELISTEFRSKAEQALITARTLQLAAQRLGIRYRREGRREATKVFWQAPRGGYTA